MYKLALINTPVRLLVDASFFPVGLAYVATAVQRTGRPLEILDFNLERPSAEESQARIAKTGARYVGITGMAIQFGLVRQYAQMAKKLLPGCTVIVGGRATAVPELVLRVPEVDYCVMGDGETTVVELLAALDRGEDPILLNVPGLTAMRQGLLRRTPGREFVRDLDVLGRPKYELFDVDRYVANQTKTGAFRGARGRRSLNFISSRGCPFRCNFCGEDTDSLRKRSIQSTLDEIEELVARYRLEHIHFSDGLFVNNRRRVTEFCDEYDRRGLKFAWSGNARVDIVTEELLGRMRASGCSHLGYGFETGSPRMLKAMNKTTTVEQNQRALELNRRLGIEVSSTFIFGARGETYGTMFETAQFIMRNRFKPSAIAFMMIFPGTPDWSYALEKGIITDPCAYLDAMAGEVQKTRFNAIKPLVNMTQMNTLGFVAWGKLLQKACDSYLWAHRVKDYYSVNGPAKTAGKAMKQAVGRLLS